jgi:hypothetical protein
MKHLILLNDPPDGTERSYNGLCAWPMRSSGTIPRPRFLSFCLLDVGIVPPLGGWRRFAHQP